MKYFRMERVDDDSGEIRYEFHGGPECPFFIVVYEDVKLANVVNEALSDFFSGRDE